MRILRSTTARFLASLLLGIVVVVLTAPFSGVSRCADGIGGGTCDSRWYTAFGADPLPLQVALLMGAAVAIAAWFLLLGLARRGPSTPR